MLLEMKPACLPTGSPGRTGWLPGLFFFYLDQRYGRSIVFVDLHAEPAVGLCCVHGIDADVVAYLDVERDLRPIVVVVTDIRIVVKEDGASRLRIAEFHRFDVSSEIVFQALLVQIGDL